MQEHMDISKLLDGLKKKMVFFSDMQCKYCIRPMLSVFVNNFHSKNQVFCMGSLYHGSQLFMNTQ